jgi:two-component system, cell cycle sensor histidine kinase PleC
MALWLAAPVAAIIVLVLLASAWVVREAATQIDRADAQSEIRLARTAFDLVAKQVAASIDDFSHWDDTYDHVNEQADLEWTKENLGPYLATAFEISNVFVFDRTGRLVYGSLPDKDGTAEVTSESAPPLAGIDISGLRSHAMLALERALAGDIDGVQGFVEFNGHVAFLAARAIRPDTLAREQKEMPRNAMVYLKVFDAAELASMSESFGLAELRIESGYRVPLLSPNGGKPEFGVGWTPRQTGATFASENAGALFALAAVGLFLIFLIGSGWYRAFESIRRAEMQALADRAQSVQETARAKSLFVANMSHELRTPLNAIIGFSELIKEQVLGPINIPKYREYAADIHASGMHLLGIVNNILQLSKIEAHQQRLTIENLSLGEVASDALRMVMPDAAKRGIQIVQEAEDLPLVRADAQALTQIVVNLMSNAVKFSALGGVVRLKMKQAPDRARVLLTVSDSGCGMPSATLAQLGRPFTQAEDPYRRNQQGTGLGLSICFALARDMGGSLAIESEEGVGTKATLNLEPASAIGGATKAAA